mmetsp:Transcript_8562/g.10994  ORF Transcript_8562/g.10994 Transcript_8562/m.10994 type:complete len:505 (-) Transcript_8562:33-1547(-)
MSEQDEAETTTKRTRPTDFDLFGDSSDDDDDDDDDVKAVAADSSKRKKELSALSDSSDDENADEGAASTKKQKKRILQKKLMKKIPKKKKVAKDGEGGEPKSKKERMEQLQRRKQAARRQEYTKKEKEAKLADKSKNKASNGYASGDSYESDPEAAKRTLEDDEFLDMEGEDEDVVKEFYQEQKFHDERGIDDKGKHKDDIDSDDEREDRKEKDETNPIMQAVNRMKKIKRVEMSRDEREEVAQMFVQRMKEASEEDLESIKARKPALKKLTMLKEVQEMIAKKDMQRPLLDYQLLTVAKAWIAPLPNGQLGNVTVRQNILESIKAITGGNDGEEGVNARDLKDSGIGKVIMGLYKHKSETPQLKRLHKSLIEQWSRPIFNKSSNMKDLERAQRDYRAHSTMTTTYQRQESLKGPTQEPSGEDDLSSIFKKGFRQAKDLGSNRVRIPTSKGFQFTVRPEARTDSTIKLKKAGREGLNKRLTVKRKGAIGKKSGGLSVEGRPSKG